MALTFTNLGDVGKRPTSRLVELDVGEMPLHAKTFIIPDPRALSTSRITGNVAFVAPTDKDIDELEMDAIELKIAPGNGTVIVNLRGLEGYIEGKFKIFYIIG